MHTYRELSILRRNHVQYIGNGLIIDEDTNSTLANVGEGLAVVYRGLIHLCSIEGEVQASQCFGGEGY